MDLPDLNSSKSELFFQFLRRGRRRSAEAKDRLGERADYGVHRRVLPILRPTVRNEVQPDEWIVPQDHCGSMPPMNLGAGLDVIEVEGTDGSQSPDTRHPMNMTVRDHHIGPCGPSAIEVSRCRDVCASTDGEDLLGVRQAIAYCRFATPHQVGEVGHGVSVSRRA
jgi:hypothetical protein